MNIYEGSQAARNILSSPCSSDESAPAATFKETLYTVSEAATIFRWSYDSTLRYFRTVGGIMRKRPAHPFTKLRTHILIPESVLKREWERLTTSQTARVTTLTPARLTPKRVAMTPKQWSDIERRMSDGESVSALALDFGLTRAAIYKHQKQKAHADAIKLVQIAA